MVSTLISEKNIISDQLDQIRILNAYNEGVMNAIPAGVIVTGTDGSIEFCNEYFAALVGAPVGALKGSRLRDVMQESFTLRSGRPAGDAFGPDGAAVVEGLQRTVANGHSLHFTAKGSSITLAGSRRGSLIVLEDVTAAERFWARLTVADRVTSLGILSAGMAHEINNPLGTILSHVSYLKAVEKEGDKLDSISWIESETNRIAAIIRRIRVYSAPGRTAGFAAPTSTASRRRPSRCCGSPWDGRSFHLPWTSPTISTALLCPPDELKQVVLNILLNACEACAERGAISLGTSRDADGAGGAFHCRQRSRNQLVRSRQHFRPVFHDEVRHAGQWPWTVDLLCYRQARGRGHLRVQHTGQGNKGGGGAPCR